MPKADYDRAIDEFGDWNIEKLRIVRKPLEGYQQTVPKILGSVTGGKGKPHIDKYFHTYNEMALRDPKTGKRTVVMLEKNQTLNAKVNRDGGIDPSHDAIAIDTSAWGKEGGRTLREYEARHRTHHEEKLDKSFERYSVLNNNCQVYQYGGLEANNIATQEARAFINQPLEQVLPKWFGKVMQPLTDLSRGVDNFLDLFRGKQIKHSPISQHISAQSPDGSMVIQE